MYYPGAIVLWAAFALALVSTSAYAVAVKRGGRWLEIGRQAYVLMTAAVVIAAALLMYLLLTHDYRVYYVYAYSDNALPLPYLVSTFWAGQEGSFLLWIFWGVLLGLPLMRTAKGWEERVMVLYNLTLLSLLVLMLKQNPFRFHQGLTADVIPPDGQGLNPLLQNPWMVIHPPVMFLGYAALAIPFAFALAALMMRRYEEWAKVTQPWVLLALGTLGLAIMLGGYWAYETLGWGGYWGWDPVENASFVPWLATAALAHGMLLERARKRFRRTNLILAVLAYLLVVYATFLTRSGVLSDFSVHAFVDLGLSGWLIFNMLFFLLLSVGLLAWRWREIPTEEGREPFFSRTVLAFLGILLLVLIALVVGLGTSAPLITRLWGTPSQVTATFYNRTGFWLAALLGVGLGVSPFLTWGGPSDRAGRKLLASALAAAGLVAAGALLLGPRLGWVRALEGVELRLAGSRAAVFAAAALFAVLANLWALAVKLRAGRWRATGAALAHVGLGLMLLGFLTTGWLGLEQKTSLEQGRPASVLGYTMTFRGIEKPTPSSHEAMLVESVAPGGSSFQLRPRMWVNPKSNQLIANPAIRAGVVQDLYVAPSSYDPPEETSGSVLTLKKGEAARFRDWTLRFLRFDLPHHGDDGGPMSVGVLLELERPGAAAAEVEPRLAFSDTGEVQRVAVPIPGLAGASIRAVGIDADQGLARVELVGVGGGVGRTALLHKGESLTYRDLGITFSGFDLTGFDPEAGKIDFGVVFEVNRGSERSQVVPRFSSGQEGVVVTPAEVPGSGGVTLSVGRIDAEGGTVQLEVVDPEVAAPPPVPAKLVVDVSTKPLIALVWLGTVLVVAGVFLAAVRRAKDAAVA